MKEVTNKTLLTSMIVIGAIIVLMIIPLYPKGYVNTRSLGANAFLSTDNLAVNNTVNPDIYMNTSYPVSAFRTSSTRTITNTVEVPTRRTQTYYYTTYENNTSDVQGYVPAGCEGGIDYSLTTGEACG